MVPRQDAAALLDLLAFSVASAIIVVQSKATGRTSRLVHGQQLADALVLDMRQWFTPTAANYFGRVSKQHILEALAEARQQPPAPRCES